MSSLEDFSGMDILIAFYTGISFLVGLSGNLFVLITSHVYKSISVDSVTIIFIRHLAAADCLFIINTVLPTLISVLCRNWVLGKVLCDLTAHFNFMPILLNVHLVLYLSLYKLLVCLFPMRMRNIGGAHAKFFVVIAYLSSGVELVLSVTLGKVGVYKVPVYRCLSMVYKLYPSLMAWSAALRFGVPTLLITLCNIWVLAVARRRTRQSVQTMAVVTVGAVSGLFVLSWAPKLIYITVVSITKEQVPWAVAFSHYFPFINSVGNPIIYTFTNRRYGQFVRDLFSKIKITIRPDSESTRSTPDTARDS